MAKSNTSRTLFANLNPPGAMIFVGRSVESAILKKVMSSPESEMVAIIGRRRVGKTFLVRSVYGDVIHFELVGMQNGRLSEQLQNFRFSLSSFFPTQEWGVVPKSWLEAFHMLIVSLEKSKTSEKRVIFFDELPWLSSKRSRFIEALGFFWNSWASKNNVVVVICGSAASWMIRHVIDQKGSLYNRVTCRIQLQPFTLCETEQYLHSRQVYLDRYQILLLYMCMGGVPHYLKEIQPGKSAMQAIEAVCLSPNGLLFDEFDKLYLALFDHPEIHLQIIIALARKWAGMTQNEIVLQSGKTSGGSLTRVLEELEQSGFISSYSPFNKRKKDTLYRLTDAYSIFYLRFIKGTLQFKEGQGIVMQQTPTWKAWTGFAFENICLQHIYALKKALGISGIYSTHSSFVHRGKAQDAGAQIDLVIDRSDHTINVCEMKFYTEAFELSKKDAENLKHKVTVFKQQTGTSKHVFVTLFTTFDMKPGIHATGLIDHHFDLDILFACE